MVLDLLAVAQLTLSGGLGVVAAERVAYLVNAAATSGEGWSWLSAQLERRQYPQLRAWTRSAPRTHSARLLAAALDPSEQTLEEVLSDLHAQAIARLDVLRVGATLSSTVGLLVGIVRLRDAHAAPSGLLALEAGLVARVAMSEALFSMAVGVGTSAACFYALAFLRRSAHKLLAGNAQLARKLREDPDLCR